MEWIRIKTTQDVYYNAFLKIFRESFPIFEQRTDAQFQQVMGDDRCHICVTLENKKVVGLVVYWLFKDYFYIEYLAIHPDERGKHRGTQMLSYLLNSIPKNCILEIDPLCDEISKKRLKFYQGLGFETNSYVHTHPAYRREYKDHKLIVLSSSPLSEKGYNQYYQDLSKVVMK